MLKHVSTIAIIALAMGLNALLLESAALRSGNAGYLLGRIAGATATAFLIGALGAWMIGKWRGASAGAFHRRTNWIALVIVLASAAGRMASVQ